MSTKLERVVFEVRMLRADFRAGIIERLYALVDEAGARLGVAPGEAAILSWWMDAETMAWEFEGWRAPGWDANGSPVEGV